MIPLGHNRINGTVYPKFNFKAEICSALLIFNSHPINNTLCFENPKLNPNNHNS